MVALELDEGLAAKASETLIEQGIDNVAVVTGPLEEGYPSEGPYDVILLGGAVEVIPQPLFEQLREGGRLVAVVGYGRAAPAMVYTHTDDDFGGRPVFDVHMPPLPGSGSQNPLSSRDLSNAVVVSASQASGFLRCVRNGMFDGASKATTVAPWASV